MEKVDRVMDLYMEYSDRFVSQSARGERKPGGVRLGMLVCWYIVLYLETHPQEIAPFVVVVVPSPFPLNSPLRSMLISK